MRLACELTENKLSHPARFADAIRALAQDAHRFRHAPSPAPFQILSRRIETLSSVLGDRRDGPLGSWLNNLGRELRTAAVRRAKSPQRMCTCVDESSGRQPLFLSVGAVLCQERTIPHVIVKV
jgi:hypothetical protein